MSQSSWVYIATGVERPIVTPSQVRTRASLMRAVDTLAQSIVTLIDLGISELVTNNQGDAVDTAVEKLTGDASSTYAYGELAAGSAAFATGLDDAADTLEICLSDMDARALAMENYAETVVAMAPPRARQTIFRGELNTTVTDLEAIADAAAAEITLELSLNVPLLPDTPDRDDLPSGFRPDEGYVDPRIADIWSQLAPEQQEAFLEGVIHDRLESAGINPDSIDLEFRSFAGTADQYASGYYEPSASVLFIPIRGESIHINTEMMGDPDILNTAAHEAQHALQAAALSIYRGMSDDDILDIRAGLEPDPFLAYGLTADEVHSMYHNPYILVDSSSHPNYPYYLAQPDEVDARQAGRDYGSGMSYDAFLEYAEEAGIMIEDGTVVN